MKTNLLTRTTLALFIFGSLLPLRADTPVSWGLVGPGSLLNQFDDSVAIAAGGYRTAVVRSNGTVVTEEIAGQFGRTLLPVPPQATGLVGIAVGRSHFLGLKNDGSVVTWYGNAEQYLTHDPVYVLAGLDGVVAVSAGFHDAALLREDGTLGLWGNSFFGPHQQGYVVRNGGAIPPDYRGIFAPGFPLANPLPVYVGVSSGGYHRLAVKEDGSIQTFGYNGNGQCTVPAGLNNVAAVAAGGYHSLALNTNGTVVGWGYNFYGQATVPAGLTDVVAIAAGGYHSLALKRDGTVVAWGYNGQGQATVPAGLTGVTAIAAGEYHSVALKGRFQFTFQGSGNLSGSILGRPSRTLLDEPSSTKVSSVGEPLINSAGGLAWIAGLTTPPYTGGFSAIVAATPALAKGGVAGRIVVRNGDPAVGIPGAVFRQDTSFSDVSLGDDGDIVFRARVTGGGAAAGNDEGIWLYESSTRSLSLIARLGSVAPGTRGSRFETFHRAELAGGSVGPVIIFAAANPVGFFNPVHEEDPPDFGVWVVGSDGQLHLLLRKGEFIRGKRLSAFYVHPSQFHNDKREVAIKVYFLGEPYDEMEILKFRIP